MGNKAILMSIRPQYVAKILNGEKTIEVRKKFPKDYVGWVYIYCTKKYKITQANNGEYVTEYDKNYRINSRFSIHGKVVARFWCDNVDDYVNGRKWSFKIGAIMWGASNYYEYILKDTCLNDDELRNYVEDLSFSAIHITRLEVFDKPKELKEFRPYQWGLYCAWTNCNCLFHTKEECSNCKETHIQKAPQSWCYVEGV